MDLPPEVDLLLSFATEKERPGRLEDVYCLCRGQTVFWVAIQLFRVLLVDVQGKLQPGDFPKFERGSDFWVAGRVGGPLPSQIWRVVRLAIDSLNKPRNMLKEPRQN